MGKHLQTICLSIFIFFCSACNYKFPAHEVFISSEQMGKQYSMIYLDSAGRSFQNYADNIVKQFQQTFSYAYDPSAINRFNNCDSFIILNDTEKEIFEAVLLAIKEDSTIINPPSDSETISSLFMKMQLKNDTLFKYDPSFKFDISSMADNYLLQQLAALLGNYRIENYKITVNNAMRVKGKNFKGDSWEEE